MEPSASYSHVEIDPVAGARLARIPRIRVAQLATDYLAHGWSAEEICRQHPFLTLAEVHSAMAYYFDHQIEMDAEIREEWAQVQADAPQVPVSLMMRLRPRKAV